MEPSSNKQTIETFKTDGMQNIEKMKVIYVDSDVVRCIVW